jgi:HD superfamily phosphohydrolase
MKKDKVIRDPIHGNIKISPAEVKLVDTPEFQRLRRVKQNGLCYLVYPAMNSTRFEHSLGVMHLASMVGEQLNLKEEELTVLRVAGLLHDIGHCPFSHTSDEIVRKQGSSHEALASEIISGGRICEILTDEGISERRVSNLILGKGKMSKIISSGIDADKMDYLIRDSYYAGVAYGVIDLDRIIHSLKKVNTDIVVKLGGLEAVESLLISRNLMYQTVYRHHTKRIAESMFKKAIESVFESGTMEFEDFKSKDDQELESALMEGTDYSRMIVDRLRNRRLFKVVYSERLSSIDEPFLEDVKDCRTELEERLTTDYGLEEGMVLIDVPETSMSEFRILIDHDETLKSIDEVSALARALEKTEMEKLTLCVYTAPENVGLFKDFDPEKYLTFKQRKLRSYS